MLRIVNESQFAEIQELDTTIYKLAKLADLYNHTRVIYGA